ncbi:MAG TPA: hypothetical protein VMT37_08840 [Solirubrobacterales bacterium]|nr:hypothetical protein [Solirubrobacterales bacterium]
MPGGTTKTTICAALLACALLLPARALAVPPANDDFAGAVELTGEPAVAAGTTVGATRETGEPEPAGGPGDASVWYRWTPQRSGEIRVHCTSFRDVVVGVYTGASLGSLTEVVSDGTGAECAYPDARFLAAAGTTYWVAVDTVAGAGGFEIELANGSPVPANDDFANATPVKDFGGNAAAEGSTLGASREPGEPAIGGSATGSSIWFRWTAQRTGTARIFPCVGSFHPVVAAFTGSAVNALTPVGTPADAAMGDRACGLGGIGGLTLPAVAGQTYSIAVDGAGGQTGWAQLSIIEAPFPLYGPQVTLGRKVRIKRGRARIWFRAAYPEAEFHCRLDGGKTLPCLSPVTYTGLRAGSHRFEVSATVQGLIPVGPSVRHFAIKRGRR